MAAHVRGQLLAEDLPADGSQQACQRCRAHGARPPGLGRKAAGLPKRRPRRRVVSSETVTWSFTQQFRFFETPGVHPIGPDVARAGRSTFVSHHTAASLGRMMERSHPSVPLVEASSTMTHRQSTSWRTTLPDDSVKNRTRFLVGITTVTALDMYDSTSLSTEAGPATP